MSIKHLIVLCFMVMGCLLMTNMASAWWNATYLNRMNISCSGMTVGTPMVVNGSTGFLIAGDDYSRQYVWVKCANNLAVYYNSPNDYKIATLTNTVPYDVEQGNITSLNGSEVWTSYVSVYHGQNLSDAKGNNLLKAFNTVRYLENTSKCAVARCFHLDGSTSTLYNATTVTGFTDGTLNMSVLIWAFRSSGVSGGNNHLFGVGQNTLQHGYQVYDGGGAVTYHMMGAIYGSSDFRTYVNGSGKALYAFRTFNETNAGLSFMKHTGTTSLNSSSAIALVSHTTPYAIFLGTAWNSLGANSWATNDANSTLDEVRIAQGYISNLELFEYRQNLDAAAGYGILNTIEAAPPSAPIANGTALYFTFNQNNATGVHDYSNSSMDGAVIGATWTQNGRYAGAYSFNGYQNISIEKQSSYNISGKSFSVSAWIYSNDETTTNDPRIIYDIKSGVGGFIMYLNNMRPYFQVTNYTNAGVGSIYNAAIPFHEWHQVVGVYDIEIGNISIYYDGIKRDTDRLVGGAGDSRNPICLGYVSGDAVDDIWNGTIDEVRVFNYALTNTQVMQLYNKTYFKYDTPPINKTYVLPSMPPTANASIQVNMSLVLPMDNFDLNITLVNCSEKVNTGDTWTSLFVYPSSSCMYNRTVTYSHRMHLGKTTFWAEVNDSLGNNVSQTWTYHVYMIDNPLVDAQVFSIYINANATTAYFGEDIEGNCTLASNITSASFNCYSAMISNNEPVNLNCTDELATRQGRFDMWVSCRLTDSYAFTEVVNSTKTSIWIDNWPPQFTDFRFDLDGQSVRLRNITGQFNITDSNIFRVNVTIDNTSIFDIVGINSTSWNYTLNRRVDDLAIGVHNFKVGVWDAHTANAIPDYEVDANLFSNSLKFTTAKNEIEIKALDEGFTVTNPFTASKEVDRYVFDYYPDDVKQATYRFEVETTQPIYVVDRPQYKWKKWLVSGNNWIDFYQEDNPSSTPTITKTAWNKVVVEVTPPKELVDGKEVIEFSSVGDLNYQQYNFTFYTYNLTLSYLASADEGEYQSTTLLFQNSTTSNAYQAVFLLNGTSNFAWTATNTSSVLLNSTFITPEWNATVVVQNRWQFNFSGEVNTINFSQTNARAAIDDCTIYNITSIIFNLYHEDYPASALNGSIEFMVTYWTNNISKTRTYSTYRNDSNTYLFCIANETNQFNMNLYAIDTIPSGFAHRYYVYNGTLNATAQSFYLYNFNYTSGISELQLTLRDYYTNKYIPDMVVKLQRLYLGDGVWRTVQMDKTDDYGLTIFNVIEQANDYRLVFMGTNNVVYKTTNSMKFACTSGLCQLTYQLDRTAASASTNDVYVLWNYTISTNSINFTWADAASGTSIVNTTVTQHTYTGTRTICAADQTGAAGVVNCNTAGYTGEAFVEVITNGEQAVSEWLQLNTTKLGNIIGNQEGALWAGLIIITCGMFGLVSPAVAMIAMIIGLVGVYLLGMFVPLTMTALVLATLIGIAIGWRVRQ